MKQLLRHSTTSLKRHNWESYSIEYIIGGKDADNVPLLKLFLQDYTELFSTKVNAGCFKCLKNYHDNYKQKLYKMENQNTCQYKLKPKYQNIPLEFGSNVFINNKNITDEYAVKLLERYKDADKIFEVYPQTETTNEVVEENEITEATTENVEPQKKTRKKRK